MENVSNKDNTIRNILIAFALICIVTIAIMIRKENRLETDLNISRQNESALTDSVRVSKNKAGELEYSKNVLVADAEDLKELNKDLYDEMQKEKGKVSELSKYLIAIKSNPKDTIKLPGTIVAYPDGSKGVEWEYDKKFDTKNSRFIKGVTNFKIDFTTATYEVIPLETLILQDDFTIEVVQGLRENEKGDVEMFVRSTYPGFELKELNSAIINPKTHPVLKKFTTQSKQKRFGVGVYSGYGVYIDNFNNTAGFGAQIGFGVTYSLFNF